MIKKIISALPDNEFKASKDEFIAFSKRLNELLEEIDEILMKKYIKELDLLFEVMNAL